MPSNYITREGGGGGVSSQLVHSVPPWFQRGGGWDSRQHFQIPIKNSSYSIEFFFFMIFLICSEGNSFLEKYPEYVECINITMQLFCKITFLVTNVFSGEIKVLFFECISFANKVWIQWAIYGIFITSIFFLPISVLNVVGFL